MFSYAIYLLSWGLWYCKLLGRFYTITGASKSAEFAVNNLEQSSSFLFEWLNSNYIKVNTSKSYVSLSGNSRATTTIDNSYIESEDEQVLLLLGITIDSN